MCLRYMYITYEIHMFRMSISEHMFYIYAKCMYFICSTYVLHMKKCNANFFDFFFQFFIYESKIKSQVKILKCTNLSVFI